MLNSVVGMYTDRAKTNQILTRAWNTELYTQTPSVNISNGTFRVTQNAGDPLSRVNYRCGGPNQLSSLIFTSNRMDKDGVPSSCDTSGIPPSSCNVKYVYDSSDFTRFVKEQSINQNNQSKKT